MSAKDEGIISRAGRFIAWLVGAVLVTTFLTHIQIVGGLVWSEHDLWLHIQQEELALAKPLSPALDHALSKLLALTDELRAISDQHFLHKRLNFRQTVRGELLPGWGILDWIGGTPNYEEQALRFMKSQVEFALRANLLEGDAALCRPRDATAERALVRSFATASGSGCRGVTH